jgi:DNA-binding CsgD family transcriptional regulator
VRSTPPTSGSAHGGKGGEPFGHRTRGRLEHACPVPLIGRDQDVAEGDPDADDEGCSHCLTGLVRVEQLTRKEPRAAAHGLMSREMQVLHLVAAGKINHAIAADLVIAVDRHVTNVFTKLGVSSRAAATAYAYQHRLL